MITWNVHGHANVTNDNRIHKMQDRHKLLVPLFKSPPRWFHCVEVAGADPLRDLRERKRDRDKAIASPAREREGKIEIGRICLSLITIGFYFLSLSIYGLAALNIARF